MKVLFKIFTMLLPAFFIIGCDEYKDSNEDLLVETLFGNNDNRLLDYNAVKDNDKLLFWSEEFDNNDSKWPSDTALTHSDNASFLEDGKMIIDYYEDRGWATFPVFIDENKNFELEMRMYWKHEDYDGQTYLYNFYNPAMSKQGEPEYNTLSIVYYNNVMNVQLYSENRYYVLMPASDFSVLLTDYNLTTVRKIGTKYSIFINGKYLYTLSKNEFSCNPMRLDVNNGINKLDYFRLSYLKN